MHVAVASSVQAHIEREKKQAFARVKVISSPDMHVFRLQEEAGEPGRNPQTQGEREQVHTEWPQVCCDATA